jgi:hypothetical protein
VRLQRLGKLKSTMTSPGIVLLTCSMVLERTKLPSGQLYGRKLPACSTGSPLWLTAQLQDAASSVPLERAALRSTTSTWSSLHISVSTKRFQITVIALVGPFYGCIHRDGFPCRRTIDCPAQSSKTPMRVSSRLHVQMAPIPTESTNTGIVGSNPT